MNLSHEAIQEGAGVTFVYRADPVDSSPIVSLDAYEVERVARWVREATLREVVGILRRRGLPFFDIEAIHSLLEQPASPQVDNPVENFDEPISTPGQCDVRFAPSRALFDTEGIMLVLDMQSEDDDRRAEVFLSWKNLEQLHEQAGAILAGHRSVPPVG